MKLIIEPFNFEHANFCIDQKIDAIILGSEDYSLRNSYNFTDEEILKIISNKKNTKIFIKVNAFFFEHQIDKLTNYLIRISKWEIDGVIFSDFAIAQINEELKLNLKLRYNPDTLVTSYFQFPFYIENNFSCVSLARELSLIELSEILSNKTNELELEIQGHGYLFIMHSRWKLISNFEKYYDINLKHKELKIKENLRKLPNIITQDKHGTHMFSGYQICTIDILDKIRNIDWLRIDCINMNEEEAYKLVTLYKESIDMLNSNNNEYNEKTKDIYKQITKFSSSLISHSFLGKMKDILHMEKNDD